MSDHLSQSTFLELLHPKTDEHMNPSVEVHHLVGKLSTAETLLTEVQLKVPTCPRSFLVINVSNQGKTLCSPCRYKRKLHFIVKYHIFKTHMLLACPKYSVRNTVITGLYYSLYPPPTTERKVFRERN